MTNRKMKDSGVEWIGDIPIHWKLVSVKHLFIIGRGRVIAKTELDDNGDYPVYSSQTKNNGVLGFIDTYDYDVSQLTWTTDGANAGTVFLREGKYNCTNVCGTLLPKISNMSMKYMKYALEYIAIFHKRADTNGFKIMNNEMAVIKILLPLENEQKKIAAFLDEKVSHVDSIIEDTKKSIENLKAYKQSLITETVTKGLSPDVETKDSGVEWFGRIPSHWKVSKVGNVFEVILGKMLSTFPKESNWTEERYLSAINVHFEGVETFNLKKMWFSPVEKEKLEVKFGDLLVVEGGAGAGGSALYLSEEKGIYVQNSINIVRPKANLSNTSFAYYIFYCLVKNGYVDYVSNKATIPHFTKEKVQSVPYPIIPLNEQQVIVEFLDERIKQVDSLIDQKEQLVIELESYKKSLIYEYVTGKKEVK